MRKITGKIWKEALLSASNNLQNKKNAINALNVFPVPDGDTGSNMASTIASINEIKEDIVEISEVSKRISQNMLMSARGNSGVILSQIFKGFSIGFKNKIDATVFDIIKAFENASKSAYTAVLKPIEGTILTVIREVAEGLKEQVTMDASVDEVFKAAVKLARKSCDNTPKLLAVLQEVGVTDSGGEGLYAILEGIASYFDNKPIELSYTEEKIDKFIADTEVFNGEFGYCTEFIMEFYNDFVLNKNALTKKLEKNGNSLVLINDGNLLKVHIHTRRPGNVLNLVNSWGQFLKIKIENMTIQANESKENAEKRTSNKDEVTSNIKKNPCALISCNTGQGIIELAKERGVAYVVEGGQTNNPSIQDIVDAINKVDAQTVFILPNNSNITLSAQQAATIVRNKEVIIIPTKSQAQTLPIAINFSATNSVAENRDLMNDAIKNVRYGEVAPSIKDTKLNGIKIRNGEYMVIANNELRDTAKTGNEAAIKLIDNLISEDSQLVTIIYGQDVSETDAKEIQDYIEINYDVAVEVLSGGQSIYPYLVSVE
ncbi:DAK2 domain-containing protein [Mycoplasma phocoeninasale]|uniref:DAK2 domain-containing protein n=1 Tax=Mycoplasma phocoeninasale TaxID=2726117 RepID=A0A858U6L3_9MOLU|nr:DAK2 domain-containing protein [Mycoplasma phocoeninasale]MBN0970511.1 DAK2 domain-containing protein [Mycoplasma phocoeninasale]QJG66366.1 DAK2 domain-containing protein [Mycoplasma phocoeninasale]